MRQFLFFECRLTSSEPKSIRINAAILIYIILYIHYTIHAGACMPAKWIYTLLAVVPAIPHTPYLSCRIRETTFACIHFIAANEQQGADERRRYVKVYYNSRRYIYIYNRYRYV